MREEQAEYFRPEGFPQEDLALCLGAGLRLRRLPPAAVVRVFWDTFDGRLYRRGEVLESVEEKQAVRLLWRRLGGEPLRSLAAPAPRLAADLPPGAFRRRLEAVTDVRALLPLARLQTRSRSWEVLGGGDKVVCRVFAEEYRVGPPDGGELRPLRARTRVEPVRGYPDAARQVRAALTRLPGLEPATGDVLLGALAALGRRPPDYTSKLRAALEPGMTAAEAVRRVLLGLLETLEANEEGTRAALDPEFLHDFRVAVRRTRSALGQLRGIFPPAARERFRADFGWLGAQTGPARDLDVHLIHLPEYRAALPESAGADLEPLRALLAARQEAEHRSVAKALASRQYRGLVAEWRAFLEEGSGPWVQDAGAPEAGRPVRHVADARIRKVLRRALREGRAIRDTSPPEELHELRKTCKKLRYLLEFFQGLYPGEDAAALIASLKGLQDNLGAHHDVHVQSEALAGFARELEGAVGAGPGTQRALGMLLERLRAREGQLRAEFSRRFETFAADVAASRLPALRKRREEPPAGRVREGA